MLDKGAASWVKTSKARSITFSPNATFTIGIESFRGCTELTSVTLGHVTSIGASAFRESSLIASFIADLSAIKTLPDFTFYYAFAPGSGIDLAFNNPALTSIASSVFAYSKARSIKFNSDATFTIGTETFRSCTELTSVVLGHVVSMGYAVFQSCSAITSFVADLSAITAVLDNTFYSAFASGSGIELNFSSPALTSVNNSAFAYSKVRSVTFNQNATFTIGIESFRSCTEMTSIVLGHVKSIGGAAFYLSSAITSFIADLSQVTAIADSTFMSAFAPGSGVELVFGSDGLTSVGYNVFQNSKVRSVKFSPNASFTILDNVFANCAELVELDLGGVASIGLNVFLSCNALKILRVSNPNPPTLNSSIPITILQTIYVPAASLSAYQNATGWVAYANFMQGF